MSTWMTTRSCGRSWTLNPSLLLILSLVPAAPAAAWPGIDADENIMLFATAAYPADDGWMVPLRGWVYEPEHDSFRRRLVMSSVLDALDLDEEPVKSERFQFRTRGFLVDNERGEKFDVELAGERFRVGPTDARGHFETHVRLPADTVRRLLPPPPGLGIPAKLQCRAVLDEPDDRVFSGVVYFPSRSGVSVISDIDDTIKLTGLQDARGALSRTLLEEFAAVPGMAEVYQDWARQGVFFHYVSVTPWQMYVPVSEFLTEAGFPEGTLELNRMRVSVRELLRMYENAGDCKASAVESLLDRYPNRKFVLIGDSSQDDPEMYAAAARRRPGQVLHILIRDLDRVGIDSERYRAAFADLPEGLVRLFDNAAELAALRIDSVD